MYTYGFMDRYKLYAQVQVDYHTYRDIQTQGHMYIYIYACAHIPKLYAFISAKEQGNLFFTLNIWSSL